MRITNSIKFFFIAGIILFNKRIFANDCQNESGICKESVKSSVITEKDTICYNTEDKKLYKITKTDENLLASGTDKISAGYKCNAGDCSKIEEDGLYDNLTLPNWYIYYSKTKPEELKLYEAIKYAVYHHNEADIVICRNNKSCKLINADNKTYYINYGDNLLISCLQKEGTTLVNCSKSNESNNKKGYYINSGPDQSTNPLIYCEPKQCISTSKEEVYLINSGSDSKLNDSLIYCSKDSCSIAKASNNQFYLGFIDNYPGLISCKDDKCVKHESYYINASELDKVFYCSNNSCQLEEPGQIPDEASHQIIPGECYVEKNDLIMIESLYFVNVELRSGFPGIKSNTKTLFRITHKSITRVSIDGTLLIDNDTHKIKMNPTNLTSKDSLYQCKKNKMICNKINSCSKKSYFLDIENKIGFACNNNKLELLSPGYYIDSGRSVGGSRNNYLIYCQSENECISIANPANYYINGGRTPELSNNKEVSTDTLIYCKSNICTTTSGTAGGHYIAGGNDDDDTLLNNGYIYCTSSSHCENRKSNGESYFLNSGENKTRNGVIKCSSGRCESIDATYDGSVDSNRKIIECTSKIKLTCEKMNAAKGFYISNTSNILIDCTGSVSTTTTMAVNHSNNKRDTQIVYNIISCSDTGCVQLSASELAAIPICTFQNNKCFINDKLTSNSDNSIASGDYCTNSDHSIIYFATDTIVVDPEIIDGTTSIYVTTTTTSNCIEVSDEYSSYFYAVNGSIYRVGDSRIVQETRSGYYFINVITNTLANGINIEDYNNPNVKLFKCNDNNCYMVDNPTTLTYYADVNKRIIAFNPNSESYFFPYEEDIKCIYNNNKCTPNTDLNGREFCITYKGELVLASTDINNNIISYIFGSSQYLYEMNSNSAQTVETTGYYVVSLATNSTASFKDYNSGVNIIKIYGCVLSSCKEYQPKEGIYYYDYLSRSMYKYEDGFWSTPSISGYAMASIYPNESYIYKFSTSMNRVTLEGKAISGYYYTVDDEINVYCLYDSEGIEKTVCVKQNCNIGEYYFIDGIYYRCESGSIYNYISAKYCNYNERVVVNFPTAINSNYPPEIHEAISNISEKNNSTAIINNTINNYLTVIPGIFTNCTYNYEKKSTKFDLLCINNFVALDEEKVAQICSVEQLGYVECIEDESNKKKCNPSSAFANIQ
ncbi:scaffoldin [Neocallimastix californiae]|uniref:Scaffoldin n=1 Tax=Neocallimastix californiae TaxID=1754190 RepID=A0A1Y1YDW3_9FUNG|nr:scaffoldin [Neocallimastix californiae]|eukprot:ORX95804.1 scaffoldin [Neocallimastix californiae]